MTKPQRNTLQAGCAVVIVITAIGHHHARAQSDQERVSRYFRRGADATSVPPPGQPGADYFRRGADATSVPAPGQAGADYFRRGADVTSLPAPGQPGAELFQRGADVTSVPADVTSMPADDAPSTEDPAIEVEAPHDPEPAQEAPPALAPTAPQPAAEAVDETTDLPEPAPIEAVPPATDGIVSLLPAWPTFVEPPPVPDEATKAAPAVDPVDAPADDTSALDRAIEPPSAFDQLVTQLKRVLLGIRIAAIVLATLSAILAVVAWRALRQRHH